MTNTRTVEDTLFRVQNLILNGKNVISTDLLKDIEQHLVDYAVVCRGAERMKQLWMNVNSAKTSSRLKD